MITLRQEKLLNFIIKEYVKTAKPVGSALVAKKGDFDLGPASLRSEMCELEKAGYLSQLHTSGGRVPTDRAYRYFVNNIIENSGIEPALNEKRKIRTAVNSTNDPRRMNINIARVLSGLSDNLVISKILEEPDFYKIGLSGLFEMPDFREFDKMFRLTSFFDEFDQIFDQIEKEFFGKFENNDILGVNVFIGHENLHPSIRDETVMTARYNMPDGLTGTLTLIGPTRMNYERNIGLIKYTTEMLNKTARRI